GHHPAPPARDRHRPGAQTPPPHPPHGGQTPVHNTTAMLIELGAIILALGLLGRLAGRVGFSPIPLYLLAGPAFGHGGILPLPASQEFVASGAEIGLTLLLPSPRPQHRAPRPLPNL